MNSILGYLTAFCLCFCPMLVQAAQTDQAQGWPREIVLSQGTVVLYQPQPEKLEGNQLYSRAAVSGQMKGAKDPVFGAVWFIATLETDHADRTAVISAAKVTRMRFPNQDPNKDKRLKELLEREIPKWRITISLDRLASSLELAEVRAKQIKNIKTAPPKIVFMDQPAVLISIDGKPRLSKIEGTNLMRVLNTPFTIILTTKSQTYYLYADKNTWYQAKDMKGKWTHTQRVPAEVAARTPKEQPKPEGQEQTAKEQKPGPPPRVIVAYEPTELISSNGKPEYTPVSGTGLLYMTNSDSDVFMDIRTQKNYVLLSGRWYVSAKLEGPWSYLPGGKLPADFKKIPKDSEVANVLYAVPGTSAAKEAVLDANIPQTGAINRKQASLTVKYDGEPKFEAIKGTKLSYAVNTDTPVIFAERKYYACDEAVWFVGVSPKGPWQVATSIPEAIYYIPPECPIYNVTYVYIYKSTPDVVYVGYTSGYTGTYVYHSTIVYGTGYWYPGWYGYYYYPRPATWGFHVRWSPWGGWRCGFSYGWGPFRFYVGRGGWYRGGWWGPRRYAGYGRGYRHGYRHGYRRGARAGYHAGQRHSNNKNMYRSQRNKTRSVARSSPASTRARSTRAAGRSNNVYANPSGQVYRKSGQDWQKRSGNSWQSQQPRQDNRSKANTQRLNNSHQSRQRGENRARSYSGSRGGGRGGGGRGGGGGRRR